MRKVNKLAAAIAVALSAGVVAPQANAVITLKSNGVGDALLFPAFNGHVANYFTINNTSGDYVQGHIRFRGAGWTSELLDFDVILSPYDVFVFRLADIDGDGQWEIDQSLDPINFAYTSLTRGCSGAVVRDNCIDASNALEPTVLPAADIAYNRNTGYVEFIGEARFDGMTSAHMDALLGNASLAAVGLTSAHRSGVGTRLGTNAWRWSTAGSVSNIPNYPDDQGLSDFGNIVSGTAFMTVPGQSMGIAYNAEALVNFRTASGLGTHRIENYTRGVNWIADHPHPDTVTGASSLVLDTAVILHNEDSSVADDQYVYRFDDIIGDGGVFEQRVSYNNTWGPTMADGDDYNVAGRGTDLLGITDDYDLRYLNVNSIAEVEEAIRLGGQTYTSFYFDKDVFDKTRTDGSNEGGVLVSSATLSSWYFALFPTKYFSAERGAFAANTLQAYIDEKVYLLVNSAKVINVGVCDIFESCGTTAGGTLVSPVVEEVQITSLGQELSFFDIGFLKGDLLSANTYTSGRVSIAPALNFNNPTTFPLQGWPGLFYTFEISSDGKVGQWRSMQR
ncbi:MAG: hypothetical protein GY862_22775 [Gammaproteobacteria bacterium]|nr:hypothetical protein [Gammaproteobacteria bacterium]